MNPMDTVVEDLAVSLLICLPLWALGFWQQRALKSRDVIHAARWLAAICGSANREVDRGWLLIQMGDVGFFLMLAFIWAFVPPGQFRVHVLGMGSLALLLLMATGKFVLGRLH